MDLIPPFSPGRDLGLHLWPSSPLHLGRGFAGCWAELHHDWHLRGTICDGGGAWGQGFEVNWHAIWGSVRGSSDPETPQILKQPFEAPLYRRENRFRKVRRPAQGCRPRTNRRLSPNTL